MQFDLNADVFGQITYVCAILGGILLLLCVILAAFFVYAQFKKHCGRHSRRPSVFHLSSNAGHYTVVPTVNPEVVAANNGIVSKGDQFDVDGHEEMGRRLIPGELGDSDRAVRIVQAGTNSRKPQVRKCKTDYVRLREFVISRQRLPCNRRSDLRWIHVRFC